MATNTPIDKEQVDLAAKLTTAINAMAGSAERAEKSFENQVTIMEKLAAAVNGIDSKRLEMMGKTNLGGFSGSLDKTGKSAGTMTQRLRDAATMMSKKLPVAAGVGVGALSGLEQGFRNITALGKGVFSFFSTVVTSLYDLGASIVAIPFKMWNGLIDMANKGASGMNELGQAIENLRKEFGSLSGPTSHAVIEMSKSLNGFSDTGLSSWRVFGTLAERIEAFTKLAAAMGGTFGVLTKEFEKNGGAILAYQKGLGISDEQMAAFAQKAISQGRSISKVLNETAKYALALGKAFGVDSKVISKDMAKAMVDVKHFGGATVKQIGEAATYARKLGLELDKITGTLDAFETFDTAAENAAKLSQSFGVTVDAFKLMEAQSPAEQLDQLRKAFAAAGKSSDTMSRQELKLLQQTTGLDEATAKMAFSTKNQGVSLDEIKKKSGEAEKKTLSQADAMKKLADSIERMVKSGESSGGFFDHFIKGMVDGFMSSKEFRTVMIDIQRGMRGVYQIGRELGRMLPKLIPDLGEFMKGLAMLFNPAKFTALFRGFKDAIEWFLKDPQASFSGLMERIQKAFFDFFDSEKPAGKKLLESFKNMFKKLAKFIGEGIEWASKRLAEGLTSLAEFIRNPKEWLEKTKGTGSDVMKFIIEALTPIGDALKEAWTVLYPAFKDLLKTVFEKISEFLLSAEFRTIMAPLYPILAIAFFGPIFAKAALGALTTSLMKSLLSGSVLSGIGGGISSLSGVLGAVGTAIGPALGLALGIAAVAAMLTYIAVNGKASIDETFKRESDRARTWAEARISAENAMGHGVSTNAKIAELAALDKKVADMDAASADRQKKLADQSFFNTDNMLYNTRELLGLGEEIVDNKERQLTINSQLALREEIFARKRKQQLDDEATSGLSAVRRKAEEAARAGPLGGPTTVGDARQKLQSMDDLVKKLRGKDYKINEIMDEIRSKFKDANFEVFSGEGADKKAGSLAVGDEQMKRINAYVDNAVSTFTGLGKLPSVLSKATASLKTDAVQPAIDAVFKMMESIKKLDTAMGDASMNKIDIVAKLGSIASAVGLGKSASYSIENKGVNITLNLEVSMNVDDVEKVVVLREKSIIRDRLNYLTAPIGPPAPPRLGTGGLKETAYVNIPPPGTKS